MITEGCQNDRGADGHTGKRKADHTTTAFVNGYLLVTTRIPICVSDTGTLIEFGFEPIDEFWNPRKASFVGLDDFYVSSEDESRIIYDSMIWLDTSIMYDKTEHAFYVADQLNDSE